MPRKRTYLQAHQFQPHAADAEAVAELANVRFCRFGLTPRGRVYGVGGRIGDSNVSALLKLPKLIEVSVSNPGNTPVFTDEGFGELFGESSVQIFSCANNPALTDRSAEAIKTSKQLRWLGLKDCTITDKGVEHISKQTRLLGLYLPNNQISEKCVPDLCRLTNLRRLNLRYTPITDSARGTLSEHLTKCRDMRLGTAE